MGQEYSASRYDTITQEILFKVLPRDGYPQERDEANEFFGAVHDTAIENDMSEDELLAAFAREELYGGADYGFKGAKAVKAAWKKLQKAFKKATSLDLQIAHVGEGLRGSDLCDETVFFISNNYIRNPSAVEFEKKHKVSVSEQWFMDAG